MPPIKPEPGMAYDFEVIDIIQLPVGNITSFIGNPSIQYDRLTPANATVEVDGVAVGKIYLNTQSTTGRNSTNASIATQDNFDPTQFTGKKLVLRCTFAA